MNLRTIFLIFASVTLLIAFQNCGPHSSAFKNNPLFKTEGTSSGNPSKITFAQVSNAVFQPKCVSCHDSGKSVVRYDSYEATIDKGNLDSLSTHYAAGTTPNNLCATVTVEEMQLVLDWISLGAPR